MTTPTGNRDSNYTFQSSKQLAEYRGMTASAALYYPSLAGNSWDDELLPSGD